MTFVRRGTHWRRIQLLRSVLYVNSFIKCRPTQIYDVVCGVCMVFGLGIGPTNVLEVQYDDYV